MFDFGQQNRQNDDSRQSAQKSGKRRFPGDQTKPEEAFRDLRSKNEARNGAETSKNSARSQQRLGGLL